MAVRCALCRHVFKCQYILSSYLPAHLLLQSCSRGCHLPCTAYALLLRCKPKRRRVLSDRAAGQQAHPSPVSRTSPQRQLCPGRPGTAACGSSARGCGSAAMPNSPVMRWLGRRYLELARTLQQLYPQLDSLH